MDEARKKLRLNCRWSLHPWRRLKCSEGWRIIHANLVNFCHKSRDFSERVRNTTFLSFVTLSYANRQVDRGDITYFSTITRNSIHAFMFAPPEVYCFQLYLWAKYFTLQSPLLKSWIWLNPELRKSRRILISNSTNWFMKNDFRSRPPRRLILRRPRLFAVPSLLGRLRFCRKS